MSYPLLQAVIDESPAAILTVQFFEELQSALLSSENLSGEDTFNGTAGRAISIPEQADVNYRVFVTPVGDPGAALGRVWVTKTTTAFTVFSEGAAGANFDWAIFNLETI